MTDAEQLNPDICTFCAELLGLSEKSNYGKWVENVGRGRVLWRNNQFAVLPSLGPLVRDHLLLIPSYHEFAFANLTGGSLRAAQAVISSLAQFFASRSRPFVVFEHGALLIDATEYERRLRRSQSGACTDHAHLHIIPDLYAPDLVHAIEKTSVFDKKIELRSLSELHSKAASDMAYIIIGDHRTKNWLLYLCQNIPRQFMRRTVASMLGVVKWDWYEYPQLASVQQTIEKYGACIEKVLSR